MPTKKTGRKKTSELGRLWRSRAAGQRMLRFLVKLNIFAIPLYLILFFDLQWAGLQTFIAQTVHAMLNIAGIAAERVGNFIVIPMQGGQWAAFIDWDCTGWKSFLALFALVMATDFARKTKLKGLAVMIPAIFAVNLIRITFMFYYVNSFGLAYFEFVHAMIWSWGLIIAILAFWVIWLHHYRFAK
jgi:exosortase/archaeosortase family protein